PPYSILNGLIAHEDLYFSILCTKQIMPLGFYMLACLIWLFLEKRTIDDTILSNIGFYIVVVLLFLALKKQFNFLMIDPLSFLYLQYYYTLAKTTSANFSCKLIYFSYNGKNHD
ncbi:hypothetical protein ACJX0J_029123, partial [Zea mays]